MKKMMIALLGFAIIVGTSSCSKKVVVAKQPVSASAKNGPRLTTLMQSYVRDISPKDSALFFAKAWFYNSAPVELKKYIFDKNKPFSVEGGVSHKTNSDVNIEKSVPEMTPGKMVSFKLDGDNPHIIAGLEISFDANDRTYHLKFFRRTDGSFVVGAKAIVFYQNGKYNVDVTISSDKTCILKHYEDKDNSVNQVKEFAKGQTDSNSNSSTGTPSTTPKEDEKKASETEDDWDKK